MSSVFVSRSLRRPRLLAAGLVLSLIAGRVGRAQSLPQVSIVATDSLATEPRVAPVLVAPPLVQPSAPDLCNVTVRLSERARVATTVRFEVAGTATSGSDYVDFKREVTIPAGAQSVTLAIAPIDDAQIERDETVLVTLLENAGYTLLTRAPTARVTIIDTDQSITLSTTGGAVQEPSSPPTTLRVERLGTLRGTQVVRLSYGGTATLGTDYTAPDSVIIPAGVAAATASIAPRSDAQQEGAETIVVAVGGMPFQPSGGVSVSIVDAAVTMAGPPAPVGEIEGQVANVTITRSGDVTLAATFSVTTNGSASIGVDYQAPPTSIAFAAGASTVVIPITIRGDVSSEVEETINLFLSGNSAYPAAAGMAAVRIAANGPLPTAVTLAATTLPPGTETTGVIALSQPGIPGGTVFVNSTNPSATISDATGTLPFASSQTLSMSQGATSVGFRVRIAASAATGTATFTVQPGGIQSVLTIGGVVTHTIGVSGTTPGAALVDSAVVSSGGTVAARVRLSLPVTATTFVSLTSTNPAATLPPSMTLAPGEVEKAFTIVAGSVASPQTALIIASRSNLADTLRVRVLGPVAVEALAVAATTVPSGGNTTATVTLNQPAPSGGTLVTVTSSSQGATVPATVSVPGGAQSAVFTISVPTFGAFGNQTAQIAVAAGGGIASQTLTLVPHRVTLNAGFLATSGVPFPLEVRLNQPAPSQGLTVALSSSSASFPVPETITLAAGEETKTISVVPAGVGTQVNAVLTATFGGSVAKSNVTVRIARLISVAVSAFTVVGSGAAVTGTIQLEGVAPSAGLPMNIVATPAHLVVIPSVIVVPSGASTAQFTAVNAPTVDNGGGSVTVQVTAPDGEVRSTSYQAVPAARVLSLQLGPSTIPAGGTVNGTVNLTRVAAAGGKVVTITVPTGADAVTVPTSVTVAEGTLQVGFIITTHAGTGGRAVLISADGVTATLTIVP